jgi:UDP-sulfoquinovose synthase
MMLAARGHEVMVVDNYLRRTIAQQTSSEALMPNPNLEDRCRIFREVAGLNVASRVGDLADYRFMEGIFRDFKPEAAVHYAEQPSAPYSMRGFDEARLTLNNNLNVTFNLIHAVQAQVPGCHIVKLGTMGEYGTPNIDIEEGWLEIEHKGRKGTFLFPRAAGSLYHTTKVLDTDLLWFYVRTFGLRVTDLMQGPVYGLSTDETDADERLLPNFHYDDIFGTVVNRFLVQAVAGVPLTVYGKGGQVRGYLNLRDTMQCIELAVDKPAEAGELRILNQFTETFSVNALAERVKRVGDGMGLGVKVESIANPRKEAEDHYYNPAHSALLDLGLKPTLLSDDILASMLEQVIAHKGAIVLDRILPRVRWSS